MDTQDMNTAEDAIVHHTRVVVPGLIMAGCVQKHNMSSLRRLHSNAWDLTITANCIFPTHLSLVARVEIAYLDGCGLPGPTNGAMIQSGQ